MEHFDEENQKHGKSTHTYEESKTIKDKALNKLKKIIEADLKRLYDKSPNIPILEQLEICYDNDYFTSEELEEISTNIEKLKKVSSKNSVDRNDALNYLKTTIQTLDIKCPWKTNKCF